VPALNERSPLRARHARQRASLSLSRARARARRVSIFIRRSRRPRRKRNSRAAPGKRRATRRASELLAAWRSARRIVICRLRAVPRWISAAPFRGRLMINTCRETKARAARACGAHSRVPRLIAARRAETCRAGVPFGLLMP